MMLKLTRAAFDTAYRAHEVWWGARWLSTARSIEGAPFSTAVDAATAAGSTPPVPDGRTSPPPTVPAAAAAPAAGSLQQQQLASARSEPLLPAPRRLQTSPTLSGYAAACATHSHGHDRSTESPVVHSRGIHRRAGFSSRSSKELTGDEYYDTLAPGVATDILQCSKRKQNGVSMKYILGFGSHPLDQQMMMSARFLKEELPVRLAQRIVELNDGLPPLLSSQSQIIKCKGWYADSFRDIRWFPAIKDHQDVVAFTDMLKQALRRHANVVPAIAKGVEQYKRILESQKGRHSDSELAPDGPADIQTFLDTFFMSRIAIRFLVGHHVALHEHANLANHIGLIDTQCSPLQVVTDAVADARSICFREYGEAPSVDIVGNPDLRFAYVPSHLHHMVFELIKNSLRAVHDRFSRMDDDEDAPVITVVIAGGVEDITIKVADQGGGIRRSGAKHIWTYLYTTAKSPLPDLDVDDLSNLPAVLAGYGCGLPLTRLHARYFGGDLQIISMEGYGTDAFLHLNRLGSDEEPLPGKV